MLHLLLECTGFRKKRSLYILRHCCGFVYDRIVEITKRAVRFAGNLVHTETVHFIYFNNLFF